MGTDLISQNMNSTTMGPDGRPLKGYAAGGFNAQGQFQQNPNGPIQNTAPQQQTAPQSAVAAPQPSPTRNQAAAATMQAQAPGQMQQASPSPTAVDPYGQQGQRPSYEFQPMPQRFGSLLGMRMNQQAAQQMPQAGDTYGQPQQAPSDAPNLDAGSDAANQSDAQAQAQQMLSQQQGNPTLQPIQQFGRSGANRFGARQARMGGMNRRLY